VAGLSYFGRFCAVLAGAAIVAARPARAESLAVSDAAAATPAEEDSRWAPSNAFAPGVWPTNLPWKNTFFYVENSTTTQTVGVGASYQSRDPFYEITIGLRPRLYLFESKTTEISLRADVGISSERTNSDTTTERNEWTATDFELSSSFAFELRSSKTDSTEVELRLPRVTLPTSKVSYDSGKLLDLGARALLAEDVLIAGRASAFFPNFVFGLRGEYGYQFTRAKVPTNSSLEIIRLDPDGRSVVSDQLGGATFASQSALIGGFTSLYIHQSLEWTTLLDIRPAWHYPVRQDTPICGVVLTGCTTATGVDSPQTRSALTSFASDFLLQVSDSVGVSVGYLNLSPQIGPDGRRRSVFYSPDARFYAQVSVGLDQLYGAAVHRPKPHLAARSSSRHF